MKFLNAIRFSADVSVSKATSFEGDEQSDIIKNLLRSSVLIRPEIFPRVYANIKIALANIGQKEELDTFFLYQSNDMQAAYVRGIGYCKKPVFLLSSSIIERMSDDELKFVIGHEYGHYFYRHTSIPETANPVSVLRKGMLSRASEISADRIGLIACGNVKAATSVIIKLTTGLDEKNVKFNISALLKQYKELLKFGPSAEEAMSSHPLFLIRLKALVLFSRTKQYLERNNFRNSRQIAVSEVDEILLKDFRKLSGFALSEIDNTIVQNVMLLGAMLIFASDRHLSKDEQMFFYDYFGDIDYSWTIDILKEKGIEGLSFEFEKSLRYILSSNFKDEYLERLVNFFKILAETFSSEDTKRFRSIIHGIFGENPF